VRLREAGPLIAIASELVLSPHTVRSHVKNILRKLETSSRAHAAALLMAERHRQHADGLVGAVELRRLAAEVLILSIDARDPFSSSHSRGVVELSTRVAVELGLSESDRHDVEDVARLHDVGKLGVPEAILWKPGELDPAEWAIMRRHTEIGESIVTGIEPLAHLAAAIRAAHERWDGEGYPDGLRGEQIPLASRIVFACDAYDAMTTDRTYRPAIAPAEAIGEVSRRAGAQFCPQVAATLLKVLGTPVVSGAAPARA
jgi:HD-GYP domain-containing protein (c-di-GMP phosphodiesterase class II)